MNPLVALVTFALLGNVKGILELDCSDNATCIDSMARELVRSLREQRTVKVFNVLTIEPIRTREARSKDWWLTHFLESHAFSFDWNDYTFKLSQPEGRVDALDLEIYEGRTAKDVSDPNGKKSSSKNEEEKEEDKTPKVGPKVGLRRRHKKKVIQAIIPLLFGMKSAGVVMFAMAVVTILTLKAFVASKVALLVTAGMAAKRLYETYGTGLPAASYVLWSIARYVRVLFGFPESPLNQAPTMTMPMFVMPQMGQMPQMAEMPQMSEMSQMYQSPITMTPSQ